MKCSHLFTAAAVAVAAMASPAYALTIGDARVLSFADQPLRVLIPIKAQGWEWRAMWASAQTYQIGLGLTATLYKPTGDRTEGVIEIRSKAPITEPIVDLQITFETGHRTTVHRTPILIDVQQQSVSIAETKTIPQSPLVQYERPAVNIAAQPKTGSPQVAVVQAPAQQAQQLYPQNGPFPEIKAIVTPAKEHVRASSYETPPEFAPSSVRASQGNSIPIAPILNGPKSNGEEKYVVKSGEGLHAIASRHKPALWSTDETMGHIFKSNRYAFAGSAYNTLKAGAVLTFAWTIAPQRSPQVLLKNAAFSEQPSLEKFMEPRTPPASSASYHFTESDARAAVQRHRVLQIKQE